MNDPRDDEARRVLSEQTTFVVDATKWMLLNEMLERPAVDKPQLRALLTGPSVFDAA